MLVNELVEVHLLNGKRFLGKVTMKDAEGMVMYCVPVKALEGVSPGSSALDELREMLHTVFFPWQQVEYVDIGGEPVGFDSLYWSWFRGEPVAGFFEKPVKSSRESNGEMET